MLLPPLPPYPAFNLDIAQWPAQWHGLITTADQRSCGLLGDFEDEPYEADARRVAARARVPMRLRAQLNPTPDDPHPYMVACRTQLVRVLRTT